MNIDPSPYVVPHLAATQAGIPDPLVEVERWLARLQELLGFEPLAPNEAYDLLALWAKLRRVRPELLVQLGAAEALQRAGALLAERGPSRAAKALRVSNHDGWLGQANALEQAYEDVGPAEARARLAERLLTDLDDADLVLYASRRFGVEDARLEDELARCHDWLAENAKLFLAASVHVQAVGMTFRPDLQDVDYGLAVTALKYLHLLLEAEAAEADFSLAHVSPVSPAVVRKLMDAFRQQRGS